MSKKAKIKAVGGVYFGSSFLKSFGAPWPFGKVIIYDDSMILRIRFIPMFVLRFFWLIFRGSRILKSDAIILKKAELKFKDVQGFRDKKSKFLMYEFLINHGDRNSPHFLRFCVSGKKAGYIKDFLKSKDFSKGN